MGTEDYQQLLEKQIEARQRFQRIRDMVAEASQFLTGLPARTKLAHDPINCYKKRDNSFDQDLSSIVAQISFPTAADINESARAYVQATKAVCEAWRSLGMAERTSLRAPEY